MPAIEVEDADVYCRDVRCGFLKRTPRGSVFTYLDDYLEFGEKPPNGIALNLPFDQKIFRTTGVNLHTFFAGLLPEGLWFQALQERSRTSADDLFTILIEAGSDCVGDVYAVPKGQPPAESGPALDMGKLENFSFQNAWTRILEGAPSGVLAGVMPKISDARLTLRIRSRKFQRPALLKLAPPELPRLIQNEAFWLSAAKRCGLSAAEAQVIEDGEGREGLLVNRFDRVAVPRSKTVQRLHQEDACQFLNRYPSAKYGMSLREVAEGLIEFCDAPTVQVLNLLRQYAFNYLIGNADMHAKNVSVLRSSRSGLLELSPIYDTVSVLPYKGYDRRMPLRMDGKDDNFRISDFVRFGARYRLSEPAIVASLTKIANRLEIELEKVAEIGFDAPETARIRSICQTRIDDLRRS